MERMDDLQKKIGAVVFQEAYTHACMESEWLLSVVAFNLFYVLRRIYYLSTTFHANNDFTAERKYTLTLLCLDFHHLLAMIHRYLATIFDAEAWNERRAGHRSKQFILSEARPIFRFEMLFKFTLFNLLKIPIMRDMASVISRLSGFTFFSIGENDDIASACAVNFIIMK